MNPNFRSLTKEKRELQMMRRLMPATLAAMTKIAFTLLCCTLLMLVAAPAWAPSQQAFAQNKVTHGGTISGGNGIYKVYVQDVTGSGVGLYTATTDVRHPIGSVQDVLYGGGFPGTILHYDPLVQYRHRLQCISLWTLVRVRLNRDQCGTPSRCPSAQPARRLQAPDHLCFARPLHRNEPDALTIVQDVNVNGTTFGNSTIEVTTKVTNNNTRMVVRRDDWHRYLWDFRVGVDDGPTFQAIVRMGLLLSTKPTSLSQHSSRTRWRTMTSTRAHRR